MESRVRVFGIWETGNAITSIKPMLREFYIDPRSIPVIEKTAGGQFRVHIDGFNFPILAENIPWELLA